MEEEEEEEEGVVVVEREHSADPSGQLHNNNQPGTLDQYRCN